MLSGNKAVFAAMRVWLQELSFGVGHVEQAALDGYVIADAFHTCRWREIQGRRITVRNVIIRRFGSIFEKAWRR